MYQKWDALLFLEIENDFDGSLLLASDFFIQDKMFGRIWWNVKFTFFFFFDCLHLVNFTLKGLLQPRTCL